MPFNVVDVNRDGGWSTSTNRFTAPVTGRYLFTWNYLMPTAYAGDGDARIYVNGVNTGLAAYTTDSASGSYYGRSLTAIYELAAGDYIELRAFSSFHIWGDGSIHAWHQGALIG
jgi:hypothetical protein